MRPARALLMITGATIISLLYVHQQVELVKLSYSIERKETRLKDMLDRNQRLGYNINNLQAPSRLEKALLAGKIEMGFPKKGEVVAVAKHGARARIEERVRSGSLEKISSMFRIIDLFGPGREAQAREK